jgi:hypothetical protein
MPQVGNDGVAGERVERQVLHLLSALDVVLGRIDVTARVQTHMHAAHDLARALGGVMLLEDLDLKLHVLLEAGGRPHGELRVVELETDVDDLLDR